MSPGFREPSSQSSWDLRRKYVDKRPGKFMASLRETARHCGLCDGEWPAAQAAEGLERTL